MNTFRTSALLLAAGLVASACSDSPTATYVDAPEVVLATTADRNGRGNGPAGESIVDIAVAVNQSSGEFSTLIAAVVAADLVATLDGNRQFTVFAPTDAAFAALGLDASNVGSLPADVLTDILLYHVAPGERLAEDVVSAQRIRMMNKSFTFVTVSSSGAFINDSQIVATDIDARNGVIHVIDAVLLP